jgi:hypothetical protein
VNRYRLTWHRSLPQVVEFEVEAESEEGAKVAGNDLDNSGKLDWHDDAKRFPDNETHRDKIEILETAAQIEARKLYAEHPKLPGL